MALRNILVHLDGGARTAERLKLANMLSMRHGARLVGIFAQRAAAHRVGVIATWPPEEYAEAVAASRKQFGEMTKGNTKTEWEDLNRGSEQQILQLMTDRAHHFDLVVLGQDEEGANRKVPASMVDQIIIESGRPVLVVPYAGHYEDVGRRPLFAWNDSRSAARALNDALPLLAKPCDATVVTFEQPSTSSSDTMAAILKHLGAHGVTGKEDRLIVQDVGIMDMLLNRAAEHGSDLLVAGAFGGYGFPVLSRGSGTRFLLHHMTLPVLFSH